MIIFITANQIKLQFLLIPNKFISNATFQLYIEAFISLMTNKKVE